MSLTRVLSAFAVTLAVMGISLGPTINNRFHVTERLGITEPWSPAPIGPHSGPGSGHAFGFGIVYTIVKQTGKDKTLYAVVTSREQGVEIWSSIPTLTGLPVGRKFYLIEGGKTFDEALRLVPLKKV